MAAPADNQSATLLIVDDDQSNRERLREIFENVGYRIVTANEAASALRVLKGVRCDLVALDLEMPGVDGLSLCKLLRAQPLTSKLPIIALSDSDDETRKVQALMTTLPSRLRPGNCCRELVFTYERLSANGRC
jgi:CheY-like chemotaxis protein